MITLTLPDGRTLKTTSNKPWHLVIERPDGRLVRVQSSIYRGVVEKTSERMRDDGVWIVHAP